MQNTKFNISDETRDELISILNERLADSMDLQSQAKHAHWNVKGMNFISLHELFDRVATEVDVQIDQIAERVTTLGGVAAGTVRIAAQNSTLSQYPLEIMDGRDHVEALSNSLADFGGSVRKNIEDADNLDDAVTADLFTQISSTIEKLLWFVAAHAQ